MADDISDLRLLVQLVQAGSLSEAARRLQSSPPVMSRRLASMELRLGVMLVSRGSRRFALTEEGTLLHQRALKILADIDEAVAEAATKGKEPRGTLRVSAPLQIGRRLIAPLIGRFVERYPEIEAQLSLSDSNFDIGGEESDVALTVGTPTDPDLVMRRLLVSRRVICASPAYLSRFGMPARPEDLLQHNCIRKLRGRRVMDSWRFIDERGYRDIHIKGSLATDSGEVMHEWLLNGRGIGQKALWDIEDDLETGRLVECLAGFSDDRLELCASFVGRPYLLPRIRVFVDFIAEALNAHRRAKVSEPPRQIGDKVIRILETDMQA